MASMDEVKLMPQQMTCLLHYSKFNMSRIRPACQLEDQSMGLSADRRA